MSERAYVASGPDPAEGALLVFAETARDAKRAAYPVLADWMVEYTEVRVKWLRRGADHLREREGPHVVESPRVCVRCEMWYAAEPYNEEGVCALCEGEEEAE